MISRWTDFRIILLSIKDLFSVIGAFTIIIATLEFFPHLTNLQSFLKNDSTLGYLILVGIIYGIGRNRPKNNFVFKINNRDIEICLRIGDIKRSKSSLVVPVNSEFDMSLKGSVRSAKSVKSMVIKNYFKGDFATTQKKILKQLQDQQYSNQKEGDRYKLGTTVKLESEKKNFYFVVNSHKINERRVEVKEEDLIETLNNFWSYMSVHGVKEHISMPLIGTGYGRLKLTRAEVYKEIVRSFIASCSEKNYCEKLTIYIKNEDVSKCEINVADLVEFTKLNTQYVDFKQINS